MPGETLSPPCREGTGPDREAVTAMLNRWYRGDQEALDRVLPLIYETLRRKAHYYLDGESDCLTLQATALVNEVFLKLAEAREPQFENRARFFAFAGHLMRHILVDHARANRSKKRGGGNRDIPLHEALHLSAGPTIEIAKILDLEEALKELEGVDERHVRIVEMRYFAGLSQEEIAAVLGISIRTVKREWRAARLWLARAMD